MGACYPKRTLPVAQTAEKGTCNQNQVAGHRGPPLTPTPTPEISRSGGEVRHSEPGLSPQVLIDFPNTEHAPMARFSPGPGTAHFSDCLWPAPRYSSGANRHGPAVHSASQQVFTESSKSQVWFQTQSVSVNGTDQDTDQSLLMRFTFRQGEIIKQ